MAKTASASATDSKKKADKASAGSAGVAKPAKVPKKGAAAAAASAAAKPVKENKKRKKSEPFQIVSTRILKRLREDHKDSKNTKLLFRPEVVATFRDLIEAIAIHLATSATEYNKNHLRRKNLSVTAVATVVAANLPNKKLYDYCISAALEAEQKRIAYKAEHAEENKARWAARGGNSKPKVSRQAVAVKA